MNKPHIEAGKNVCAYLTTQGIYLSETQAEQVARKIEAQDMFFHAPYMLEVIKRAWLKLNCGLDNETDSAIADACWDQICNVLGTDGAIKWSEEVVPEQD